MNYNSDDGWALMGSRGTRDVGAGSGAGFGGSRFGLGVDYEYTEYMNGSTNHTFSLNLVYLFRFEYNTDDNTVFYGFDLNFAKQYLYIGGEVDGKAGWKVNLNDF